MTFNASVALTCLFFVLGNIFGWYANNLQFVFEYWKDKALASCLIFGTPAGIFYWYATKMCMDMNPELWSARFIGATASYLVFPIMTWYYLGESMFTAKTMICIFLSLCILFVQIFLK